MPYINITEKVNNSVHTILLNRPDRLNAWTEEMAIEIKQSMDNAAKNDDVKVMRSVAARMNDQEIDALANYISGLH